MPVPLLDKCSEDWGGGLRRKVGPWGREIVTGQARTNDTAAALSPGTWDRAAAAVVVAVIQPVTIPTHGD